MNPINAFTRLNEAHENIKVAEAMLNHEKENGDSTLRAKRVFEQTRIIDAAQREIAKLNDHFENNAAYVAIAEKRLVERKNQLVALMNKKSLQKLLDLQEQINKEERKLAGIA